MAGLPDFLFFSTLVHRCIFFSTGHYHMKILSVTYLYSYWEKDHHSIVRNTRWDKRHVQKNRPLIKGQAKIQNQSSKRQGQNQARVRAISKQAQSRREQDSRTREINRVRTRRAIRILKRFGRVRHAMEIRKCFSNGWWNLPPVRRLESRAREWVCHVVRDRWIMGNGVLSLGYRCRCGGGWSEHDKHHGQMDITHDTTFRSSF